MALSHVAFPERLLTDCDSVRSGVRKPLSWAESSKRRYSRIWSAIALQLEECGANVVDWMPAHTDEGSIGQLQNSSGELIDDDMWHANQLADLLAKDGALAVRYSARARSTFIAWESQLRELAAYLGKLTHIANAFQLPDGTKIRDSDAVKSRRKLKVPGLVGAKCGGRVGKRKIAKATLKIGGASHVSKSRSGAWGKGPAWIAPNSFRGFLSVSVARKS